MEPSPPAGVAVRGATVADLEALAPLFDAYRGFYDQPGDVSRARRFLEERLERSESVVLLAFLDGVAVGFTQLYPSFSSISTARIFVLNDLFVAEAGRRRGVARRLLAAAVEFARSAGAVRMALSTALTNTEARALYESAGWKRDDHFLTYEIELS
jgi:GNAT superfamily N-acetyltransferase